jgi:hypothetical protein
VTDVAELAASYRNLAYAWGSTSDADPKTKNKTYLQLHAVQKSLATTVEGQEAIALLMNDPDPWVRLSAASHSLRWSEARARTVLEALRDEDGSMAGFDAKYVLREHDAGRLSFDF